MNRRLHELELELRRLENERDELTAAYKEAEAVSTIFLYVVLLRGTLEQLGLGNEIKRRISI